MRRRRFSILIILLTMALVFAGCGEQAPPESAAPDCGNPGVLCLGLVTDVGSISDKSFNQSSWEGILRAIAETGARGQYLETRDAKDYLANILTLERVLLDLHSGRIMGAVGPWIMDAAAILLLVLALTGIWMWTALRR